MKLINLDGLRIEDKRKYLVLVILSAFIVFFVFVVLVIVIWSRPLQKNYDDVNTNEKKLGEYSVSKFSLDTQINIYANSICSMLSSNDYDGLYELLDDEFIKYASLNKDAFKDFINKKGLGGKSLEVTEYKNVKFEKNNIIKLTIQTRNNPKITQIVIVKEKSPNDYTITFDNLVKFEQQEKKYEINGLEIILSNQAYFSNEYKANIKITNVSNSNIVLNKNKSAEIFYLNQANNVSTVVSSSIMMGKTMQLNQNDSINYNIRFLISDYTFNMINKLIIKDVTNESINNIQDLEIELK